MTWLLSPSATGSRIAKPRPSGGPPSAWMSIATFACARSMISARVVTHGPDAVVVVARQHDPRALAPQVGGKIRRDVEVVLRLGVAAVGLGAGRVTVSPSRPFQI